MKHLHTLDALTEEDVRPAEEVGRGLKHPEAYSKWVDYLFAPLKKWGVDGNRLNVFTNEFLRVFAPLKKWGVDGNSKANVASADRSVFAPLKKWGVDGNNIARRQHALNIRSPRGRSGAWIETIAWAITELVPMVRPAEEVGRGLKHFAHDSLDKLLCAVRPAEEVGRGLKLRRASPVACILAFAPLKKWGVDGNTWDGTTGRYYVGSPRGRSGAWIETHTGCSTHTYHT